MLLKTFKKIKARIINNYRKEELFMKISFNIDERLTPVRNFPKYLKETYNLKLVGLIKYICLHPEIIEQINEQIDEYDTEYRFSNRM